MHSPRLKVFKTKREKIVSELVEFIDTNSDVDAEFYKNKVLKQLKNGKLF